MSEKKKFYQELISLEDLAALEDQLRNLVEREITSVEDLEKYLLEESKLMEAIGEVLNGDYILFNCYSNDEAIAQRHQFNQTKVIPLLKKYEALLDRKFWDSPYREELEKRKYEILLQSKAVAVELFREENIELMVQETALSDEYAVTIGNTTVIWEGEEKTLPEMTMFLKDPDRQVRKAAWEKTIARRSQDWEKLDGIMDQLVQLRHRMAVNAGLADYREYMFRVYERFSYTPEDCLRFHEAVKKCVVPLKDEVEKRHQEKLGLTEYRPWDIQGTPQGQKPLIPFTEVEELVEGTKEILHRLDPLFAEVLKDLQENHTLDLVPRVGKAPGGFCCDLPISNRSFIFMNCTGTHQDLITLVHECGHAIHNKLAAHHPLARYKHAPMEAAEFASMSMEFLTMEHWGRFYKEQDLIRAQIDQLEDVIKFLPWAVTVDRFQHWLYLHPEHTAQERNEKSREIASQFSHHYTDWSGLERELSHAWKAQSHIFGNPFYYIEYAIAQLGALQLWRQYKEDPRRAIENYKRALSLGGSRPLLEIYQAAEIQFAFSEPVLAELMDFVSTELSNLRKLQG